jgi:hypothetical protein
MLPRDRSLLSGLIIAALASSIGGVALADQAAKPAKLEKIPGSDLQRVILTQKAAERLAVETVKVREEAVMRWLMVGGEVEATKDVAPTTTAVLSNTTGNPTASDVVPLRVRVPAQDSSRLIDAAFPRMSLAASAKGNDADDDDEDEAKDQANGNSDGRQKNKGASKPLKVIAVPRGDDSHAHGEMFIPLEVAFGSYASGNAQYYVVLRKKHRLRSGEHVSVRLPDPSSGTPQKVIPYSAVIYDIEGNTWTYTNPQALVFVRHRIDIDFIQDDMAVLKDGPALGTSVVTQGAAELMGVEQKVGQ